MTFGTLVFIVAVLMTLAGILMCLASEKRGPGLVLVGVAALIIGIDSCTVVPAKSVGVQVTWGKTKGALPPGLHVVAPWSKVEKYPATIQTLRLQGNGKGDDTDGPCVTVRLANQTTACVDVTVQWWVASTNRAAIEALYVRWRGFDNLEPNLVRPQLQHALLAPYETYDPLRVLNGGDAPTQTTADLERATRDALQSAVGSGLTVGSLTINLVHYDATTQDKLNAYAQALADTRIAEQRKQTAAAQKAANDALAGSAASRDPAVLYQNCLDMVERLAKDGKPLPSAFSCGGSGASVVVGAK